MKKYSYVEIIGYALLWAGYSLIIGSALAFAAMNRGEGRVQNGEFFYWQRYFVDNVVAMATQPGVWLFLFGTLLFLFIRRTKKQLVLSALAAAVVANSQFFIIPLSHKASALAFEYGRLQTVFDTLYGRQRLGRQTGRHKRTAAAGLPCNTAACSKPKDRQGSLKPKQP